LEVLARHNQPLDMWELTAPSSPLTPQRQE